MARVVLTDPALDDLRRAGPVLAALVLGRLRLLESEPAAGSPLVDERTGYRVLAALDGDARVVHDVHGDTVTIRSVWVDGARTDGEAYAETLERIQCRRPVGAGRPRRRSVRRLSRLTGARPVPRDRLRAPVPDWLADALLGRAGLERLAVAAMDAEAAFDEWSGSWRTSRRPRPKR